MFASNNYMLKKFIIGSFPANNSLPTVIKPFAYFKCHFTNVIWPFSISIQVIPLG